MGRVEIRWFLSTTLNGSGGVEYENHETARKYIKWYCHRMVYMSENGTVTELYCQRMVLSQNGTYMSQNGTVTERYCHRMVLPIVTEWYCLLSQNGTVTERYCHRMVPSQNDTVKEPFCNIMVGTVTVQYCHITVISQND